jgi:hypothetical protein
MLMAFVVVAFVIVPFVGAVIVPFVGAVVVPALGIAALMGFVIVLEGHRMLLRRGPLSRAGTPGRRSAPIRSPHRTDGRNGGNLLPCVP